MGCGCNKTVKRTSTQTKTVTRNRVDRTLLPKNNTGKVVRRILSRY
jgi:acyl-coenzyme A synthetase/AMP-(fatty) acid ligase